MFKKFLVKLFGPDWYIHHVAYYSELYQSLFRSHSLRESGIKLIPKIIARGDVVLDIGANIGKFTSFSARLTGEKGRIYAFEPVEMPRKVLAKMVSLKNLRQVKVFDVGLSDSSRPGKMVIPLRDGWRPLSMLAHTRFSQSALPNKGEIIREVQLAALDEFLKKQNIQKVDFIKCDVEGHEFFVFSGAQDTLMKYRPTVFCEVDESYLKRNNIKTGQLFRLFKNLGFGSYLAEKSEKGLRRVDGYQGATDYFFIHESKVEAVSEKIPVV